ncbi:hypothetical protein AC578_7318 [Pseudocercospora eumusae]|uniref:Uncharacterized protein n=1 Tax=Pseudocercospora eumusae TaxID=321146 RepID=A0A139HWW3_9PEZI|nr:hypothetical protein AC578_7318 [Pseudocercospora eumusae]
MGANHNYTEVGLIYDAYLAHKKIASLAEFTPDLLNEFYDVLDWERDENEAKHKKNLIHWLRRNKCDESKGARPRGGWAALVRDSCVGSTEKACKEEAIPDVVGSKEKTGQQEATPAASPSGTMQAKVSLATAPSPNTCSPSSSLKAAAVSLPPKQRKSPRNAGGVLKYLQSPPSAKSKASASSATAAAEKESSKVLNVAQPNIKQQDLLMKKSLDEAHSAFGKGDLEEAVAALSMALSLVSGRMKAGRGTAEADGAAADDEVWEECSSNADWDMEL